jgi:hypothetical protein
MMDDVLQFLNPDVIIQGGASGADELARIWATENSKSLVTYEANWAESGRSAGPIRNKQMLTENINAVVVSFPGGKGTENCVTQAKELNMLIFRVEG